MCSSELYGWNIPPAADNLRRQIIDSDWGGYGLDLGLWEDSKSPVIQVRPSEVSLDNKECCGFLSDRLMGVGSCFLTRSPENGLYILSKFVMRSKNLVDVTILRRHPHVQYIDIAYNNLSDLSFLSDLPYLMYFNASHNKIKRPLNFTSWYLTYVNLSYNDIADIGDLGNCWSIVRLNLSHNVIEHITGLENLKYLQYLNLSYNLIECIENLDNLNIQEMNLEGNCITSFKSVVPGRGINVLCKLRTIFLGYNRLSSLEFFKVIGNNKDERLKNLFPNCLSLRFVSLKFNKIVDILEALHLKGLIHEIDLRGNACTKWPNYRNVLISSIPSIKIIDGIEVFAAEKVTSATLFASPLDFTTARNVAKLTLLEQLNISEVNAHIQPYDEVSPPLVILTGPSAVKKMALALHVTRTIPDKIKYCRWHTTKEVYADDDERNTYILIDREEFNDMARRGEFLVIFDLLGHSYGFHTNQIIPLISENKIGLTQMNLYATAEISKRYSNVKAILMLTQCEDLHRTWIREKFDVYTWIKDSIENLLVIKIGKHIEDDVETTSCIFNFIEEILEKEIMAHLELPNYSVWIRPQGTGATATDIILESKTMLPKVLIKRSGTTLEKRITFEEKRDKNHIMKSLDRSLSEERHIVEGLKVIMDEESNIIIDDERTKRQLRRSKMLRRRSTLVSNAFNNDFSSDNLSDSTSTDDTMEICQNKRVGEGKAKALKDMYVELIIKTRKLYLDHHESHPGFFALVLLMDDYTKAFELLIEFIYESCVNQSYKKPVFLSEVNHFKEVAIPVTLEDIVNEMGENLSISKHQQRMMFKTNELVSSKYSMNEHITETVENSCFDLQAKTKFHYN